MPNDTTTPPDVLARICADTRAEVARRKAERGIDRLRWDITARADVPRGFGRALKSAVAAGHYGLIAEIKKASPSGGLIRPDFDPDGLARAYRDGGATCLSVLTDAPHFQGGAEHLVAARAAVDLPVLRKDFILDSWQVYESRAMGADCILLIMAALQNGQARELEAVARALDMDVLVEVHDERELQRALGLETNLIGINNRNLKTLQTDLVVTEQLAPLVPADRFMVAESGIRSTGDLRRLATAGARCFLVGESLMRQPDVTVATRELLGGLPPPGKRDRPGEGDARGILASTVVGCLAQAGERECWPMTGGFTHFDEAGNAAMVDVSAKPVTDRSATARGRVAMRPETAAMIRAGTAKKGDVLGVARVAGIMAAKRTAELIPLCHPLPISAVTLELTVGELAAGEAAVEIAATVRTTGQTGVEMEALTAASVAALTVYDMCKAVDRGMRIEAVRVVHKAGGKSGAFVQE